MIPLLRAQFDAFIDDLNEQFLLRVPGMRDMLGGQRTMDLPFLRRLTAELGRLEALRDGEPICARDCLMATRLEFGYLRFVSPRSPLSALVSAYYNEYTIAAFMDRVCARGDDREWRDALWASLSAHLETAQDLGDALRDAEVCADLFAAMVTEILDQRTARRHGVVQQMLGGLDAAVA